MHRWCCNRDERCCYAISVHLMFSKQLDKFMEEKKNPEDITHKRTSSSSPSDRLQAAGKHCSTRAGFLCSCLSEIRCLWSDPYCRGSSAPGQPWASFLERQELIPYCFPDIALWSYSPTGTGF